jgi:peptide subunit release factor 1 (eRF1)
MNRQESCKWSNHQSGVYETGCNEAHEFMVDGPEENRFSFCPYCGKEIEVVTPEPTPQEIREEKGEREYQARKDMEFEVEPGPWM